MRLFAGNADYPAGQLANCAAATWLALLYDLWILLFSALSLPFSYYYLFGFSFLFRAFSIKGEG
jgi:hypothetical protein